MLLKTTLRPILSVNLKTTIKGGVGHQVEYEAAVARRARCRHAITRVCTKSEFGLLCPEDKEDDLRAAIADAEAEADIFNKSASYTTIRVKALVSRIAATDVHAVKAIHSEIRDLLDDMVDGICNQDADAIRSAANHARDMSQTLNPNAAARVRIAIDEARTVARKIAQVDDISTLAIDEAAIRRIMEQRTAFDDPTTETVRTAEPAL